MNHVDPVDAVSALVRAPINSPANEVEPLISPDQSFMIVSIGGRGSYDLYLARRDGDTRQAPVHLPAPINSKGWDFGPSLSPDRDHRIGTGGAAMGKPIEQVSNEVESLRSMFATNQYHFSSVGTYDETRKGLDALTKRT